MSVVNPTEQLEYSESDGQPLGETDVHRRWMIRICDMLAHRYRDQHVYVGSNLLVYYLVGQPARFVVPDNFVVLDCDPSERRIFKTWEEQRAPDVVIEVTSRSTRHEDLVKKPAIYERMSVSEYYLYDPTASYLKPALQGFQLVNGQLMKLNPVSDSSLRCERLGLDLKLDGKSLLLIDHLTGSRLLTEAEAECKRADDAERAQQTAEARIRELEEQMKQWREKS